MAITYYTFDLTSDTKNIIHDGLWELVKAGSKTHNIPSKFFNGPGDTGNQLEVSIKTSYIHGKKTYTNKEFVDAFDLFSRRRMKFQRKVELTAQLKIVDWIHDKLLDSTKLTAVFYVNHSQLTEACIGLKLFDWSNADSNVDLEHPVDVPEADMKMCAALVYRMGKEVAEITKKEVEELQAMFANIKI